MKWRLYIGHNQMNLPRPVRDLVARKRVELVDIPWIEMRNRYELDIEILNAMLVHEKYGGEWILGKSDVVDCPLEYPRKFVTAAPFSSPLNDSEIPTIVDCSLTVALAKAADVVIPGGSIGFHLHMFTHGRADIEKIARILRTAGRWAESHSE